MRIELQIHKSDSGRRKVRGGMVRGVPQEQIDKLRGTRDHMDNLTSKTIKEDYARIGINISDKEAETILQAVDFYRGMGYSEMIGAYQARQNGTLEEYAKLNPSFSIAGEDRMDFFNKNADRYARVLEYSKIAPVYKPSEKTSDPFKPSGEVEFIRIVGEGNIFSNPEYPKLNNLKVGDSYTFRNPLTSFNTTKVGKVGGVLHKGYGSGGTVENKQDIILHVSPNSKLVKDAISIHGSHKFDFFDHEVLLQQRTVKITKITEETLFKNSGTFFPHRVKHVYVN
ncbi:MAG: hypothetical protein IJP96_06960 [Synergistaceae bacterium]|nr:hypothetical protein [Synergistaceae bacterium]